MSEPPPGRVISASVLVLCVAVSSAASPQAGGRNAAARVAEAPVVARWEARFGARVEREDLPPLEPPAVDARPAPAEREAEPDKTISREQSHLPVDVWRGLDLAAVESLLARADLPPRSPAMAALWKRLVAATASPPGGPQEAARFAAARAEAPYRAGLALDSSLDPLAALMAAEWAARLNIISANELADAYRRSVARATKDPNRVLETRQEQTLRRAVLFVAADREREPMRKAQAIRAYLDEARATGSYVLALRTMARALDALAPAPEFAWFAETAIETSLAADRLDRAIAWVDSGPGKSRLPALEHWLALVDIADPDAPSRRGATLAVVEELALRGSFSPEALHRLTAVLAALDYDAPAALWDVASRTPQPDGGHLPEASVLSDLADAAKKREVGRVVLLALATLGPNGPDGSHVIALGDAIRGLMRAGLGMEAHKLGLEALLAFWPRSSGGARAASEWPP